jgi:hypothetical protein
MAANYIRLDREEDARAHAAELLRIFPGYTLELDRKTSFFRDPAIKKPYLEDLRKAGIPE